MKLIIRFVGILTLSVLILILGGTSVQAKLFGTQKETTGMYTQLGENELTPSPIPSPTLTKEQLTCVKRQKKAKKTISNSPKIIENFTKKLEDNKKKLDSQINKLEQLKCDTKILRKDQQVLNKKIDTTRDNWVNSYKKYIGNLRLSRTLSCQTQIEEYRNISQTAVTEFQRLQKDFEKDGKDIQAYTKNVIQKDVKNVKCP